MVVADDQGDRRLVCLRDVQHLLGLDDVRRRGLDRGDRLVEVEIGAGGDGESQRRDRQEGAEEDPGDEAETGWWWGWRLPVAGDGADRAGREDGPAVAIGRRTAPDASLQ